MDFKKLFEQEKESRLSLQQEFEEYKESCNEIEDLLQQELQDQVTLAQEKDQALQELKAKMAQQKSDSEKFIRRLERELDSFRHKYEELAETNRRDKQKLVQLENETECMESQNRALETLNSDLESKIDSILEELALLQTELEENRQSHQNDIENIERLKQQIRDAEGELFVQQMKQKISLEGQENCAHNSNYRNPKYQGYSTASTSSSTSTNQFSLDLNSISIKADVQSNDQVEAQQMNSGRILKVNRSGNHQNIPKSNKSQICDYQKMKKADQDKQYQFQNDVDSSNSPQTSYSQKCSSNYSSGNHQESDANNYEAALDENTGEIQRGRKFTSFSGKHSERYSEEKRRLQQKLMKDKINIYDKNINCLKLTDLRFIKSLNLVANLIKDVGDKMGNIKSQKAQLITPRRPPTKKLL